MNFIVGLLTHPISTCRSKFYMAHNVDFTNNDDLKAMLLALGTILLFGAFIFIVLRI